MKHFHLHRSIALFAFLLIAHPFSHAGGRPGLRHQPADSLRPQTHEEYYEKLFDKLPPQPVKPPLLPGRRLSATTFPNIDISQDASPQNEPSVRISHADPNHVLAAWRDFRTGVTPAVRR